MISEEFSQLNNPIERSHSVLRFCKHQNLSIPFDTNLEKLTRVCWIEALKKHHLESENMKGLCFTSILMITSLSSFR
jgi:hypothetical protein